MGTWRLAFEPCDVAVVLWGLVTALAVVEGIRYVRAGRWPTLSALRVGLVLPPTLIVLLLMLTGRLRPYPETGVWACAALAVFAVLWVWRGYRQTTRPLASRTRTVLLVFRVLAVIVVLLILADPVFERVTFVREKSVIGILIDDSRSMAVRDVADPADAEGPGLTRAEAVRAGLARCEAPLRQLGRTADVRWFTFDETLHPKGGPKLELTAAGATTALRDALVEARHRLGSQAHQLAGVVLISDGRDNFSRAASGEAVARDYASQGTPIYAVAVGASESADAVPTLQIRRLQMPDQVAVGHQLSVETAFLATGLASRVVSCEVLVDVEVVQDRTVTPQRNHDLRPVRFAPVIAETGLRRVTVRLQAEAPGRGPVTAEQSQFVRVVDDQMRVLYVDRPRYERAAIGRSLASSEAMRVERIDLIEPRDESYDAPLVAEEIDWEAYQVVILGDVRAAVLGEGVTARIVEQVQARGLGLAMLGGTRTLGAGGYGATSLASIIGVDLADRGQRPGPISMKLTAAGRVHPVCQLAADVLRNIERWAALPALTGANRITGLSPTAEVLLIDGEDEPLLVVQEHAPGRVAVVAFDSTWQWSFAGDDGLDAQRRFWRQLVLWLGQRKPAVWVSTDRPRYDTGHFRSGDRQVEIEAVAAEPSTGAPIPDVRMEGGVIDPRGVESPLVMRARPQAHSGAFVPGAPGVYHVRVRAYRHDRLMGEGQAAFVVTAIDQELRDPLADPQALERIADQTGHVGGRSVPIEQMAVLFNELAASTPMIERRQVRRHRVIADGPWWVYGVFVVLISAEWFSRRRAGLV